MRVNAKLLSNYQRQTVCLLGKVLQSDPNGMSFKLESPDKQVVQVIMKNPHGRQPLERLGDARYWMQIREPLEGIIEVVGEVTAKQAIVCNSYVLFPASITEGFDMATYNSVVEVINTHQKFYPTMATGS